MKMIGLDLGFRQVKATIENRNYRFDSVIGYPSAMELTEEFEEKNPLANLTLTHEGNTYYVGAKAIRKTKNAQLTFTADKTNNKTDILKTMTALGLAMGDNEKEHFRILSGLPVDELEMENLKQEMANNLKGTHSFVFNNQQKEATIDSVKIIAQSAGAYYDYILNEDGTVKEERVKPKVVVIDVGFRTTDVVSMEDAKYNPSESFTIYTGVHNVHNELRKKIMKNYRIQKQPTEMDAVLRERRLIVNGVEVELDQTIREATIPFAEKILSELPLYIANLQEVSLFLITGGGANVMRNFFTLPSPTEFIVDPEQSNARGYYKYLKLLENNGV